MSNRRHHADGTWRASDSRRRPTPLRRGHELAGWFSVALLVYAVTFLVWTLVPGGSPRHRAVISDLAVLPASLAGALLALAASRHGHLAPATKRAWRLVSLALLSWFAGDVLWMVYEVVLDTSPFPSLADVGYLGFYPCLIWALQTLPGRPTGAGRDWKAWLDSATVDLSGTMVVWYVVVAPIVRQHDSGVLATVLNVAYPVGDLILLLLLAKLLLRRPGRGLSQPLKVMFLGIAVSAVADLAYSRVSLSGSYGAGSWVDGMFVVALALLAVSAAVQVRVAREPGGLVAPAPPRPHISMLPYGAVAIGSMPLVAVGLSQSFNPVGGLVLGTLCLAGVVMARQAIAVRENLRLVGRLDHAETVDNLTGLLNREAFVTRAEDVFTSQQARGRRVAILAIDVDHFKRINDRNGHAAGDEVLRAVAAACRTALAGADLLGRLSGDELVAVFSDMDVADAVNMAERLGDAVRSQPFCTTDQGPVTVTLSIGVADSAGLADFGALLACAGVALYDAKSSGRSCARAFVA